MGYVTNLIGYVATLCGLLRHPMWATSPPYVGYVATLFGLRRHPEMLKVVHLVYFWSEIGILHILKPNVECYPLIKKSTLKVVY